jgi:N-acetylmuramoyl-L-alanine amidase
MLSNTPDEQPEGSGLYSKLRASRKAKRLVLLHTALPLLGLVLLSGVVLLLWRTNLAPTSPAVTVTPTRGAAATPTVAAQSALISDPPATPAPASTSPPPTPTPQPATVASQQLPLSGKRIGLDPGHGPRGDMGAVLTDPTTGQLILSEAEFNLDIALRCRDILVARGASVILTRETADTFTAPWPVDANGDGIVGAAGDDLQERVDILNNFHAQAFISIHANGGQIDAAHPDVQVIYCGTSDCVAPTQSRLLGQLVLEQLTSKLAGAGYPAQDGILETDLDSDSSNPPLHDFVLGPIVPPRHVRATTMPGVLAESLYVTSPDQAAELNKDSVRQAIALAYADALQEYFAGGNN